MSVRDLGLRPFTGERRNPKTNIGVLVAFGLRRAWSSWFTRLALLFCWGPMVIAMAVVGIAAATMNAMQDGVVDPNLDTASMGASLLPDPAMVAFTLMQSNVWIFVTMVVLGTSAAAIVTDRLNGAFPFFFSKPVTRVQYWVGASVPSALCSFGVTWIPALGLIMMASGIGPEEQRWETVSLILPATVYAALVALLITALGLAVSATSRSRAIASTLLLTMLVLPTVGSSIAESIANWPWISLASPYAALGFVGEALFGLKNDDGIAWPYALAAIATMFGLSLLTLAQRLKDAEQWKS